MAPCGALGGKMNGGLTFIISSVLFGFGLAVDAFLISLAGGMNEPNAKRGKIFASALVFALFQFIAPMIGWICVCALAERFLFFNECLSAIALAVLLFLGIKMLAEGLKKKDGKEEQKPKSGFGALMVRATVSSVDALSMGFTIAEYSWQTAVAGAAIIAVITFIAYAAGFFIGRKFGTKFADKAMVIGGILFIVMALEVFFRGF